MTNRGKAFALLLSLAALGSWLVADSVLATDNFNRDENPLAAPWTLVPTTTNLLKGSASVGHAIAAVGQPAAMYYDSANWGANQYSQANLYNAGSAGSAVLARVQAAANSFYFLWPQAGGGPFKMYKMVGGGATSLGTAASGIYAQGSLGRIEVSGDQLTGAYNGGTITVTDATFAGGKPGVRVMATTNNANYGVDNWEGGNLGGSPARRRNAIVSWSLVPEAHAQSTFTRFYLVPVQGAGTDADPRRPEYDDQLCAVQCGSIDFGFEPVMLVSATMDAARDAAVTANADVQPLPLNLDAKMSASAVTAAQNWLEARNIPAGWITTSLTYRQVLRTVGGMFLFMQRFDAVHGNVRMFSGGVTLSTTLGQLQAGARADLNAAAQSLGYSTAGVTNSTTLRAALKTLADQWGAKPIVLGGTSL